MTKQDKPKPHRDAGILLHPTSLPGPHGMGDLGQVARQFVDWLQEAGLGLWQVLPLNPTGNNCPYVCWSAFAGNPLLVDLAGLAAQGLLDANDLDHSFQPTSLVDFDAVRAFKEPRLERAARRFLETENHPWKPAFRAFREKETWAQDAALFWVIKRKHGLRAWWDWAPALRDRDPAALEVVRREHAGEIDRELAVLFFFEAQWAELRAYANARDVQIIGDLPIYVDRDSVDVWAHKDLFHLEEDGRPKSVSGVPPDYFSETGQLWGNPIYNWDRMAKDDFAWWRARLSRVLTHANICRIDHFRAFSEFWEVPFGAPDARGGRWVKGPGIAFFQALERHGGDLPIIAEDLGMIDEAVHELRRAAGLPGMRVLQFAFGGDADNTHLPHNHEPDNVVYPGTHDNDTTVGWWKSSPPHVRTHAQRYMRVSGQDIAWDLIHASFMSVAQTAIVAMQDVLSLGNEARMNNPATPKGNWGWRLESPVFHRDIALRLRDLADLYGRVVKKPEAAKKK